VIARQAAQRQAADGREAALEGDVAPRLVREGQRLVEPHRQPRAQTQDERVRQPRLGLGQRPGARVLLVAGPSSRPPLPGEVAVDVDAVGILARASGDAVGVEVVDHPQIDPGDRAGVAQRAGDRDAGRLVAVNAPDDEDGGLRVRRPDLDGRDRPVIDRPPEDGGVLRGAPRHHRGQEPGKPQGAGEPHASRPGCAPASEPRLNGQGRPRGR
jgi:hypothetical protein